MKNPDPELEKVAFETVAGLTTVESLSCAYELEEIARIIRKRCAKTVSHNLTVALVVSSRFSKN